MIIKKISLWPTIYMMFFTQEKSEMIAPLKMLQREDVIIYLNLYLQSNAKLQLGAIQLFVLFC